MRGVRVAACWLLGALLPSACGGGSVTLPPTPSHTAPTASPPAYPGFIYVNGSGSTIDVFSTEVTGNVGPSRAIAGSSFPAGTDAAGVWGVDVAYGDIENLAGLPLPPYTSAGATHYSAAGAVLAKIVLPPIPIASTYSIVGAVAGATDTAGNFYLADGLRDVSDSLETEPLFDCEFMSDLQIDVYPANAAGSAVPTRTIALPFHCAIWSLTVDPAGHLWVAGDGSILEYAPGATGAATPLRTIALAFEYQGLSLSGSAAPGQGPSIAVDSAGNLYATLPAANAAELLRYGAGSSKPVRYLPSVYPVSLAFDAHDDLFVTGSFGGGRSGIAEFRYPSTVPLRLIGGSKSAVVSPGLAVTR